ncbi:hypothetical protein KDL44_09485 [bacterium]|nr:hypothetical protein [bacterium]
MYTALRLLAIILLLPAVGYAQQAPAPFVYPPLNRGLLCAGDPGHWPRSGEYDISKLADPMDIDGMLAAREMQSTIYEMPDLPSFQGWYTHVNVQNNPVELRLEPGRLSAFSYDRQWGFDPLTGELLETRDLQQDYYRDGTFALAEGWQAREPGQLQPIPSIADWSGIHESLRERPGSEVLALDARGLWMLSGNTSDGHGRPFFRYIELYAPDTAELRQTWIIPLTYLALGAELGHEHPLVLIGDGEISLFSPDSGVSEFATIGGGTITAAQYDGDTLTVAASPASLIHDFANVERDPMIADGIPLFRCYSTPSGDLLWERQAQELERKPVLDLRQTDGALLATNQYGFTIYSIEDGSLLLEQDDTSQYRMDRYMECGPAGIYWSGEYTGEQRGAELYNPATDTHIRIPALEQLYVKDLILSGNTLYVLAETHPTGHDYWSANSHLLALQLSSDGLPLPGSPVIVNAPPDYADLADQFCALRDPSLDDELMKQFIHIGINAFRPLLKRIPQLDGVQLDSLALLAAQMSPPPAPDAWMDMYDSVDALVDWLISNGSPELTEHMLRWADSGSLGWMEFTGPGIIAACGGPRAKQWLDAYYAPLLAESVNEPALPFAFQPELAVIGDIFQPDGQGSTLWQARATDAAGLHYLAYVADGLASERDIFLGVDADADGLYEEVLPTGLAHTYFYMVHPGGPRRVDELAGEYGEGGQPSLPLALEIDNDRLTIGHYRPLLETIEFDHSEEGGPQGSYQEMQGAEYVLDSLSLAELRLDSDGDGLTDVAEGLIQTDPQQPDTDGDGLPDGRDRNPLVNMATLGPTERAASRGLAFFTQYNRGFGWWWRSRLEGQPLCARYIVSEEGLGPLAIAGQQGSWNISLATREGQARYEAGLQGYNRFNSISLSMGEEIRIGNQQLGALTTLGPQFPAATDRLMHVNMALQGQYITLVEIEGEYYPVTIVGSWIS